MRRIVIDPITRLEGHFKVAVEVEQDRAYRAEVSGTLYRGFERILAGRDPRDAIFFTQRICGVCPADHAVASALALDDAFGVKPTPNGRLVRNIILAGSFVQSHLTHFYHLSLPDYVEGPEFAPFIPHYMGDYRLSKADSEKLVGRYLEALKIRRKCQEMIAHFGGKMPHQASIIAGGVTMVPSKERIRAARALLAEVAAFVRGPYEEDVETIANAYGEYFRLGRGGTNLLAYGAFPQDDDGGNPLFPRGIVVNGEIAELQVSKISEDVSYSWYTDAASGHPSKTSTVADAERKSAYSWVKAPRYDGAVFEVGPLARMWLAGRYTNGISSMDRIKARMMETKLIVETLDRWLAAVEPNGEAATQVEVPNVASGVGLSEAARGALGHWISIRGGVIDHYEAVVPTTWNASPRDGKGQPGALEAALVGVPVVDTNNPLAIMRVIHSFDPCLACAVHVYTP